MGAYEPVNIGALQPPPNKGALREGDEVDLDASDSSPIPTLKKGSTTRSISTSKEALVKTSNEASKESLVKTNTASRDVSREQSREIAPPASDRLREQKALQREIRKKEKCYITCFVVTCLLLCAACLSFFALGYFVLDFVRITHPANGVVNTTQPTLNATLTPPGNGSVAMNETNTNIGRRKNPWVEERTTIGAEVGATTIEAKTVTDSNGDALGKKSGDANDVRKAPESLPIPEDYP